MRITKDVIVKAMDLGTARWKEESWDSKKSETDYQAEEVVSLIERISAEEKVVNRG
ncbi:MAG TPA: hypothetical protein VJ248_02130 [Candidatus Udaeobacter sp.]|nr:hypothetical protein [Candidatus Udaeobacter sp.]